MRSQAILALLLYGAVSNTYGRIGVRVNNHNVINAVHANSPALRAGLQPGDVIEESDGIKGRGHVDGDAGTVAHLKIRRGHQILIFSVCRVPAEEISVDLLPPEQPAQKK